jgi:hypothetical protein
MEVLRDLVGSIRHHCSHPPAQQLLGPSFMDGAVSRHGFKFDPIVSAVCPAPDIARLPTLRLPQTDSCRGFLCLVSNITPPVGT